MARLPRDHRLESRDARAKLKARGEPYWRQIVPGTFIGYRKGKRACAWIARQRTADGYAEQRIGTPDDTGSPDGDVVLSYGQAVAKAQAVQVEARAPQARHYGEGISLNSLFEPYLADRQSSPGGPRDTTMATSTATVSRQFWTLHVQDDIGKRLVSSFTDGMLRSWLGRVAAKSPRAGPHDPTDPAQVRARRATANRILTIVKATLNHARANGAIPKDAPKFWDDVKPFKLGKAATPRMMERSEIARLLNAAAPDLRGLLTAALMTGGRRGEILALQVRDYSPEHGTVRLFQSKVGKSLTQPLTPEGAAFFDRVTAGRAATEPMFLRTDGQPWGRSDTIRPMRAAVEAAKLDDVSFKTTRATYGKLLLLATKDIEIVAKALGHSDSKITREHYAQILPGEVARGVAKMPRLGVLVDDKVSRIGKKRRAG